ncbi:toxin-antitoxin system HicB family antitoxin [Gorillibacterium sp. sgz5001074]|uniref:toxin-antitoxin system HicB family antitoxin n=1 Tax=Gorillibacterium sp. sgz5001074 TaxID=3446695 RepID=UPI003F67CABE
MPPKKSFPLRIDPQLYDALERWAADEFRSVNGHLEFLLREALQKAGRLPGRPRFKEESPE